MRVPGLLESAVRLPDGRRLRTVVAGAGGPLVLLEAGAGLCAPVWTPVQRLVGRHARVLAYDRAGYAGSDDDPAPRTLDRLVEDLAALLDAVTDAPAVLVGTSFGAVVLRAFAQAHPQGVAGLVLAEPTTTALVEPRALPAVRAVFSTIAELSRAGLHRPLVRATLHPGLGALRDVADGPGILDAAYDGRNWRAASREVHEADPALERLGLLEEAGLPDVPVTVVVGGRADRGERRSRPAHVDLTRREMAAHPRGRHVVAEHSSHFVVWQEPALVAEEVLGVVGRVRAGSPKTPRGPALPS